MPADQILFITLGLYLLGFSGLLFLHRNILVSGLSIALNLIGLGLASYLIKTFDGPIAFEYPWVTFQDTGFSASILVNRLTLLLWGLVQFIALLVQLFSTKYMEKDDRYGQYFAYLNLFVFSMLGLVASGNLLFIFVFWELVGFSSYLLIGFWYKKQSATNASLKAFIINRIGDAGFLIGITLVYVQFQTLELTTLSTIVYEPNSLLTLTGILLFAGCIGKSAQFPLQVWLPDAMEGPTPVSALIHAATMVAAGIFLLARVDFIFTTDARLFIASIGGITAVLAAYSAIFQQDIKKVLAYSTVSQLGLMVMAMGAGATNAALFHLFTHAFFKAGLFLIAGAVIHHFHHKQNMEKMGGLLKTKPLLTVLFIICAASLTGLPLFSGFLSKDAILISTWNWALGSPALMFIPILGILASVMTGFYMMRAFVLVFMPRELGKQDKSPISIFEVSIIPLALCSFWFVFGDSPLSFESSRFSSYFPIHHQESHWLGYAVLGLSLIAVMASFSFSKREITNKFSGKSAWRKFGLNHFFINKFYLNTIAKPIAGQLVSRDDDVLLHLKGFSKMVHRFDNSVIDGAIGLMSPLTRKTAAFTRYLDERWVDGTVSFISNSVQKIGGRLKLIQGGKIQSYLIALVLFLLAIMILLTLL
ncbi:MAG: NADH-quinone oxidoreductase subunit L [Algoriphagus sp.]|jgi:NADH-quinone oxidoreductase subunit L